MEPLRCGTWYEVLRSWPRAPGMSISRDSTGFCQERGYNTESCHTYCFSVLSDVCSLIVTAHQQAVQTRGGPPQERTKPFDLFDAVTVNLRTVRIPSP